MSAVWLAYDADMLWGVYASLEAAQGALDWSLEHARREAVVLDDGWVDTNLPEADHPCYRRWYDATGPWLPGYPIEQRIQRMAVKA